jgi:hypothetical protein
VLAIVESMRLRYSSERSKKENNSYNAYDDDHGSVDNQSDNPKSKGVDEGRQSEVIERLILGEVLVPESSSSAQGSINASSRHNTDADFVAFPGDRANDGDKTNISTSPMGWSHYTGLGDALNRCYRESNQKASLGTRCLGRSESLISSVDKANLAFAILGTYM